MSEQHFLDPNRLEIHLANGPISVTELRGMKIVTFSQFSPRVPDASGVSASVVDAVAVCRVALSAELIAQLNELINRSAAVNAPIAGNA